MKDDGYATCGSCPRAVSVGTKLCEVCQVYADYQAGLLVRIPYLKEFPEDKIVAKTPTTILEVEARGIRHIDRYTSSVFYKSWDTFLDYLNYLRRLESAAGSIYHLVKDEKEK